MEIHISKKGKVERPFNYIEEQFIKGNSFESMEEMNRLGKEFVDNWCNEKHTTTQRIPNQHYFLEELCALQPLPEKHYFVSEAKSRIVSNDGLVSIEGSKYSVPIKYATQKVYFRILYGFRIKIFNKKREIIFETEKVDKRIVRCDEHYENIRKPVSTSLPQIKRDFTARFKNGTKYLEESYSYISEPARHARKIMELQDLYDDWLLDEFIGKAIEEKKFEYKQFKELLRNYNSGKSQSVSDMDELTRDCSYYENL